MGNHVPFSERSGFSERLPAWEKNMDVAKILAELRLEREQIEEAIISLERLARGRGRRRGRPPSWLVEARKRTRVVSAKGRAPAMAKAPATSQR